MTVAPFLAAVLEAQSESIYRLYRWLGKCYISGEKLVK